MTSWATSNGYAVDSVVTEVGSALNGKRRKFLGLLRDPQATTIIVEHRGSGPSTWPAPLTPAIAAWW